MIYRRKDTFFFDSRVTIPPPVAAEPPTLTTSHTKTRAQPHGHAQESLFCLLCFLPMDSVTEFQHGEVKYSPFSVKALGGYLECCPLPEFFKVKIFDLKYTVS